VKGFAEMERRESEILEFKKSTTQLKEAVISLCAMLKKHRKGIVYFGIKDDGSVCGQEIGKKTTSDITILYSKPLMVRGF
jgi:ATP-dependent DNA helicase RecG